MRSLVILLSLISFLCCLVVSAEYEADELQWPFSHKNQSSAEDNHSCKSYETCNECTTASSWCHWCEHDDACHAYGSFYGCVRGSSCSPPPNKTVDACSAHANCRECALSSHLCHWCAHDNACHTVGSVYGCVTGVDCYSNQRCKRNASDPIEEFTFYEMGPLPLFGVTVSALTLLCCFSMCFCCARGVKGAYDDLADIAMDRSGLGEPLLPVPEESENTNIEDGVATPTETHLETNQTNGDVANTTEDIPPVESTVEEIPLLPRRSIRARRPRHMQRLFAACTTIYIMAITAVIGLSVAVIIYFPKRPMYNVCNDSLAWKSLIDTLTSLKVSADFEILASLANPNHFDVVLDMGKGSFTHDGAFVGTFDIPPATAKAMAITDIMIIAHLSPDKWEALSLTSEYYRGRLVLDVDATASIRVPAFFDYSFTADLQNLRVHVNEMSDRHLCACPSWGDNVTLFEF